MSTIWKNGKYLPLVKYVTLKDLKKLSTAIDIINGDSDTKGSIKKAIKDLVGEAPEAYDTLKEIADKLKSDDNLHKALNDAIILKASSDALNIEINRATSAETANKSAIDGEVTRAKSVEKSLQDQITELGTSSSDALNSEITNRTEADKVLEAKIDSVSENIKDTYLRKDEMPLIELAVTEAENVNATITEENIFEVTDRNGEKKTLNLNITGGTPAGFGEIAATVDNSTGTPSVTVTTSGTNEAKNLTFAFTGLKGEQGLQGTQGLQGERGEQGLPGNDGAKGDKGDKGDKGERGLQGERGEKGDMGSIGKISISVDNTTGTPSATATASKEADGSTDISFSFKGIKGEKGEKGLQGEKGEKGEVGMQGNSGVADVSNKTLVNDAITGGETDFLSAEVGKLGILTYDCSKGGSVTHTTLQDAINSVPTTFQKVGLTITYKSGDTLYRYTLKANSWSTDPANWFSIEDKLNDLVDKMTMDTELDKKFDKESVAQESGSAEDKVMSQKATSVELNKKADTTVLNNYVLTTALNLQVDMLKASIDAKQPKGNYLTEHQSLEEYAKKSEIAELIAAKADVTALTALEARIAALEAKHTETNTLIKA